MKKVEVLGLQTIPEIKPGDDLAMVAKALKATLRATAGAKGPARRLLTRIASRFV
jgi:hypothetical protein